MLKVWLILGVAWHPAWHSCLPLSFFRQQNYGIPCRYPGILNLWQMDVEQVKFIDMATRTFNFACELRFMINHILESAFKLCGHAAQIGFCTYHGFQSSAMTMTTSLSSTLELFPCSSLQALHTPWKNYMTHWLWSSTFHIFSKHYISIHCTSILLIHLCLHQTDPWTTQPLQMSQVLSWKHYLFS